MFTNSTKSSYMWDDLRRFTLPILLFSAIWWLLWATTSCLPDNCIRVRGMAATMATSAGTNMLQFLKLIGQLKVRNRNNLLRQKKLKNIYNVWYNSDVLYFYSANQCSLLNVNFSCVFRVCLLCLILSTEGTQDWLGLQECEETWERVRSHVPHGNDVSDHHRCYDQQGQVLCSSFLIHSLELSGAIISCLYQLYHVQMYKAGSSPWHGRVHCGGYHSVRQRQ